MTERFTSLAMGLLLVLAFALVTALYLNQRDALVQARVQLTEARSDASDALEAATACSASIDGLAQAADVFEQERNEARAAAVAKARVHGARADAVLAAPTPVPGDACASAAARFADWQGQRMQKAAP